jgi:hypothetical protein
MFIKMGSIFDLEGPDQICAGFNNIAASFGDIRQVSAKKISFSLKKQCYDPTSAQTSSNLRQEPTHLQFHLQL